MYVCAHTYVHTRAVSSFSTLPVDGHLGCFHIWAVINSVATHTEVHVSFQAVFSSGYVPKTGAAGSSGFSF